MKNRKKEKELLLKQEEKDGKSPIELARQKGDYVLCGEKTLMEYKGFTGKGRVWTIS